MLPDKNTKLDQMALTSKNRPNILDDPGLLHPVSIQYNEVH